MPKQNIIDPDVEFPKVAKMLYKLAWEARNSRFPYEEAQSEAYWAFMKCCDSFKSGKGMVFSSWVYFKVRMHLRSHLTKKIISDQRLCFMEINDEILPGAPMRRTVQDILEQRTDLSHDERELLGIILNAPQFVDTVKFDWDEMREITPLELLKRIKAHLGFERGVDSVYVDITLHELSAKLDRCQLSLT